MRGANATVAVIALALWGTSSLADTTETAFSNAPLVRGPANLAPPPPTTMSKALEPALPDHYGPFKLEPRLEPRVRFWVDVYAKYSSWETVLHDVDHPYVIYRVVNKKENPRVNMAAERAKIIQQLRAVKQNKKLKPEEKELQEMLSRYGLLAKIDQLIDAKRIRGQAGIRDNLLNALFISGRYLPRMERVLENFGMPREIAYLPFVESGFNKKAVSKVGASGIWQFMPYTGKLYLRVDDVVDERNDPMRAGEAAARLMKQNYEMLGEWPLAITAYNHGAVGVSRAAREAGSKSLYDIIEKYEGKSFGVASQNFYASFYAAMHVAKNHESYIGVLPKARILEFDEFVMPHYMELKMFLQSMDIDENDFRELNPGLTKMVYSGKRYLPVGYMVRVPVEVRGDFLVRYESIPSFFKHSSQKKDEDEVTAAAAGITGQKTE